MGEGYTDAELPEKIAKSRGLYDSSESGAGKGRTFNLLIDIEERMKDKKSPAYQRWATVYNLKQMAESFLFLREHDLVNRESLARAAGEATDRFYGLNTKIKNAEKRLAEIQVLKKHMVNYRKTKDVYAAYRKSGYSRQFFEEHREEITLHKAGKDAFEQQKAEKLPTIRELNEEYARVLTQKKADYVEYRKAKREMRDVVTAKRNIEVFYKEQGVDREASNTEISIQSLI